MSILKTLNHLYSNSFIEFLKDPYLVLYTLHIHHSSQYCHIKFNGNLYQQIYADYTEFILSFLALDFIFYSDSYS